MVKTLVVLVATACALAGCAFWHQAESQVDPATSPSGVVAQPTSSPTSAPTREIVRLEPTRVIESSSTAQAPSGAVASTEAPPPTNPPVSAPPTPTTTSQVAPASAPEATAVPGGTYLPVPERTNVVWGGCASDGQCEWYNFYWAPTHEVVMQPGEGQHKVSHERCHAHQHWSINGGAPLSPSDYDLESWYGTAEGSSFTAAVAGLSWPWTHSARNGIEDFAWTCGYYYFDPAYLLSVSPERYAWAAANLP